VTREFPFTLTGVQSSEEPLRDLKSRITTILLAIREPGINTAERIRAVPAVWANLSLALVAERQSKEGERRYIPVFNFSSDDPIYFLNH